MVVEKKGCFKDDQKPPRPLPNYILTDRDSSSKIYSGKEIDWGNWVNYLPDFVCRCAQLAKSKNFKFFGIQYYGMSGVGGMLGGGSMWGCTRFSMSIF